MSERSSSPESDFRSIAFVGLGVMGLPMAGHLLDAGHRLAVHTRSKAKADGLIAHGARWSDTPADAARGASAVFVCVPDTPDVEAVLLGEAGILAGIPAGGVVVDHSTVSPAATKQFAEQAARQGVAFLDAPVSGGDVGAKNASLSVMVGGDAAAFERVKPLLERVGKTVTHCGASGSGQLTKLVNQILVTVTNMAVCESLVFAKRNGLDLEKTIAALAGGAAGSWQFSNLGPRMVKGDFAPGFTVDLQQKDLRLVLAAARAARLDLPALSLVHHLFTQAQHTGHGKDGTQSLFAVVEQLAALSDARSTTP